MRFSARTLLSQAVLGSLLLTLAQGASAKEQLRTEVEGSLGYNTNISGVPDEPPTEDVPPKEGGVFALASPSVIYTLEQPSHAHALSYVYTANLFPLKLERSSFSNRLEYEGFFDLSPFSDLLLGAGFVQGHHNTSSSLFATPATAIQAAFPGTSPFGLVNVGETLSYSIGRNWRGVQQTGFVLQFPIDPDVRAPTTMEAHGTLGIERVFRTAAIGIEGDGDYSEIRNATDFESGAERNRRVAQAGAVGRIRQDFGRAITTRVDGGATYVRMYDPNASAWFAKGLALLGYARPNARLSLTARRDVTTNVFLGHTFLVNELRLAGGVPLDSEREVIASTSTGYQDGRVLDEDIELAAPVQVWLADVSVTWQVEKHLQLGARYQFTKQNGAELPPLPLSFDRHLGMVTVRWFYPPPVDFVRRDIAPLRVDRADAPGAEQRDRQRNQ